MSKNNTIDVCKITLDGQDYTLYGVDSEHCQYNTEFIVLMKMVLNQHLNICSTDNSVCDISSKLFNENTTLKFAIGDFRNVDYLNQFDDINNYKHISVLESLEYHTFRRL